MSFGYGHGVKTHRHGSRVAHDVKTGKRVAAVFKGDQVAHIWAQRTQTAGRSGNGNISFEGGVLYSYNEPIACFAKGARGELYALISRASFSNTTNGHQSAAWGAVGYGREENLTALGLAGVFGVSSIPRYPDDFESSKHVHARNLESILNTGRLMFDEQMRKRVDSPYALEVDAPATDGLGYNAKKSARTKGAEYLAEAETYARAFGVNALFPAKDRRRVAREFGKLADKVEAHFAEQRERQKSPAYLRRQAKRNEARAALVAELREVVTQRLDSEIAESGYPQGVTLVRDQNGPLDFYGNNRVENGSIGSQGGYRRLEGEEADAARAKWRESTIESRTQWAVKDRIAADNREKKDKREAAARIKRQDEQRAAFEEWKRGERPRCPEAFLYTPEGGAYLRVRGDQLDTSQGASVPLAHAVRAFRFVKLCRERGEPWQANGRSLRVGHFAVSSITAEGDMIAGCHRLKWAQIAEAAQAAGVFGEAAADTTETREHA